MDGWLGDDKRKKNWSDGIYGCQLRLYCGRGVILDDKSVQSDESHLIVKLRTGRDCNLRP